MSPRSIPIRLSLFYGMMFLAIGVYLPYWPVWLRDRGMGPTEIGILLAASYITKTLANAIIGARVDRHDDRRRPMILLAAASLCVYAVFLFAGSFWSLLALTVVSAAAFTTLTPLADSLTMLQAAEHGLDYGRIRLWGSLTFIAASALGGFVLERSPSMAILWLLLLFLLLLVGSAVALPDTRRTLRPRDRDAPAVPLRRLLAHPSFLLFLGAASLIQISHMIYYAFGTVHWQKAGLPGDTIGLLWGEGVAAEVILFACSGAVLQRLGPAQLVLLAAAAATLRWAVFGLTTAPLHLALAQVLHAFTFGAGHLGAMHFIARAVPRSLSAGAQGSYSAVAAGLAPGMALLVAGPLYDSLGGDAYFVAAALALGGAVLALLLIRRWDGRALDLTPPPPASPARALRIDTDRECPAPPGAPPC